MAEIVINLAISDGQDVTLLEIHRGQEASFGEGGDYALKCT